MSDKEFREKVLEFLNQWTVCRSPDTYLDFPVKPDVGTLVRLERELKMELMPESDAQLVKEISEMRHPAFHDIITRQRKCLSTAAYSALDERLFRLYREEEARCGNE